MPEYIQETNELLPEGTYNFVVADAVEKLSHGGNDTIELQLLIERDGEGEKVRVFDYLTFSPKSFWKIDSFRRATGEELVRGQKVNFEQEDCIDRKGKVFLKVGEFEGRKVNKVGNYIEPAEKAAGVEKGDPF